MPVIYRMTISRLFLLIATATFTVHSSAYELARAKVNLSGEIADCATLYRLTSIDATKMNKPEAAKKMSDLSDNAVKMLVALYPNDKDQKIAKADIDLSLKNFTETIKTEGWSRIYLMYSDSCKALMEDPSARIKYWTDKQD